MSEFTKTTENRYFEDYEPGACYEFGSIPVETQDIVAFGRQFDPQVFHIDPEGAKNTMYGGLIASGWHTGSLMMRLFVENYLPGPASLGSPGVDELRWLKPVRPGDELTLRVTVTEARRSATKPDRGIIHSYIEVLNQEKTVVMTMKALNFIMVRNPMF